MQNRVYNDISKVYSPFIVAYTHELCLKQGIIWALDQIHAYETLEDIRGFHVTSKAALGPSTVKGYIDAVFNDASVYPTTNPEMGDKFLMVPFTVSLPVTSNRRDIAALHLIDLLDTGVVVGLIADLKKA